MPKIRRSVGLVISRPGGAQAAMLDEPAVDVTWRHRADRKRSSLVQMSAEIGAALTQRLIPPVDRDRQWASGISAQRPANLDRPRPK
jgi:hypothetical protein